MKLTSSIIAFLLIFFDHRELALEHHLVVVGDVDVRFPLPRVDLRQRVDEHLGRALGFPGELLSKQSQHLVVDVVVQPALQRPHDFLPETVNTSVRFFYGVVVGDTVVPGLVHVELAPLHATAHRTRLVPLLHHKTVLRITRRTNV